jgi:hypothetical protein
MTGVADAAGNAGLGTTDSSNYAIDTKEPTVQISVSDNLITDADNLAGSKLTITITYSEAMDNSVYPTITFLPNVKLDTLSYSENWWSPDNRIYSENYLIRDANVENAGVDVTVTGGKDLAGNAQVDNTGENMFNIDTEKPTVVSVTPSVTPIADADEGAGNFTLTVVYNEPMAAVNPDLAFTPDISTTLENASYSWTDGVTCVVTYDVADANVNVVGVDVMVENARDDSGNVQVPYLNLDVFGIDTKIVKIVFTTPPQTITAGAASAVMTIQTQGLLDSPSNVDENTIIAFSSTSITGTFSSAATPWVDIAFVTIPAGSNSAGFYYKDNTVGTPTITAAESPSKGWTDVTQTQTIVLVAIVKIVFTTPPQTITAGAASAVMTIQTQDNYGNPSNVVIATIALSSSSAAGRFSLDNVTWADVTSVAIPAGENSVSFYYKDTAAGTPTITAAESPSQGWTDATQQQTVVLGVITTYDISLSAGWNLISLPLIPDNSSIENVLASIMDHVEVVWYYNAATENWLVYTPGEAPDTLLTMEDGKGYWVKMSAPATLTVYGVVIPTPPATPPTYSVLPGWNLIGFKSTSSMTANTYLTGVAGKWVSLWTFDPDVGAYDKVLGTDLMLPSRGYWIYMTEAGVIVP